MPPRPESAQRVGDAAVRAAPAPQAETLRPPAQAATVGIDGPQAAGLGTSSSVDDPTARAHTVSTGFGELPLSGRPPLLPPPRVDSAQARIAPPAPQRVVHPPAPTRPDTALPDSLRIHTPREHAATVPLPTPPLADRGQQIALAPQERHPAADTQPPPAYHSAQPTHEAPPPTAVFTKSPEPVAADGQTHQETHPAAPEAGDLHLPSPVRTTAEPGTTASPKTLQEGLPVLVAHTPGDDTRPASSHQQGEPNSGADTSPATQTGGGMGGRGDGRTPAAAAGELPPPGEGDHVTTVLREIAERVRLMREQGLVGADTPAYIIYEQALQQSLASGELTPGTVLFGSRRIAALVGNLSYIDVITAHHDLADQGLLAVTNYGSVILGEGIDPETVTRSLKSKPVMDSITVIPPGLKLTSPAVLGNSLGVDRSIVYDVLHELEASGEVIRQGNEWFRTSSTEQSDPRMAEFLRMIQASTNIGVVLRALIKDYNIPNEQLPSSNQFASLLDVAPRTIVTVFTTLRELGFIETTRGISGATLLRELPPLIPSSEHVMEYIYGLIGSVQLRPNQPIPSPDTLAQTLHADPTIVDAAIRELTAEGMLRIGDNDVLVLSIREADWVEIIVRERLKRMRPGDQLPSQREFAAELGISKGPPQKAYGRLRAEGLIDTENRFRTLAGGEYLSEADRVESIVRERLKRMRAGEKLPSKRQLARDLIVNPNLVQRLYTQLRTEGVVATDHMNTFATGTAYVEEELENDNE